MSEAGRPSRAPPIHLAVDPLKRIDSYDRPLFGNTRNWLPKPATIWMPQGLKPRVAERGRGRKTQGREIFNHEIREVHEKGKRHGGEIFNRCSALMNADAV